MGPLELLAVVILVLWIGGYSLSIGGSAVHLLLVVLLVIVIIRLLQRRDPIP